MMKITSNLNNKILNLCSDNPLLLDKMREILAGEKCAAVTTKGTVCSYGVKQNGYCGLHSRREIVQCAFVRTDGSECSLNASRNGTCWLHSTPVDEKVVRRRRPRPVLVPELVASEPALKPELIEPEPVPVSEPAALEPVLPAPVEPEPEPVLPAPVLPAPVEPEPEPVLPAPVEPVPAPTAAAPTTSLSNVPICDAQEYQNCCIDVKGSRCNALLKVGKFVCAKHRAYSLTRKCLSGTMRYDCPTLSSLCVRPPSYNEKSLTIGYAEQEIDKDDDSTIDEEIALPKFRSRNCIYLDLEGKMCLEVCHPKSIMCKDHRKFSKQFAHNSGTRRYYDPFWTVKRPFLEKSRVIAPNYHWFSHLNFFAHITKRGPVVIGKVWCGIFPETLQTCPVNRYVRYDRLANLNIAKDSYTEEEEEMGDETCMKGKIENWNEIYKYDNDFCEAETTEDLIRRCHNNGLLYKVLSQRTLHRQFNIPDDLDSIEGFGFTSFSQMIQERPSLYIKYWNVWLGHIRRAKDFTRFIGASSDALRRYLNIDEPFDWNYYLTELGPKIGLYHVEVPAPPLEQVTSRAFNPFEYARDWVMQNEPDRIVEPWFPPYHLLYPFPDDYHEELYYHQHRTRVEDIGDKKLYMHYYIRPGMRACVKSWIQWLKYGENEGALSSLYIYRPIPDNPPMEIVNLAKVKTAEREEYKQKYPAEYATIYAR